MSTFDRQWRKIPTKYGLILFVFLAAYFLLMRALGFGHVYWLRILNLLIVFFVLRAAMMSYYNKTKGQKYEDFMDFFRISLRTSFIGIGVFSIFLAIYLDKLDPAFMEGILQIETVDPYMSPVAASVMVFIEGMASAMVCGFILTQVVKRKTVEKPVGAKATLRKEVEN